MVRHIVLLEWSDDIYDEAIDAFIAALGELPGKIEEISSYSFGSDLDIAGSTADFAIVAEFDTASDYIVYRNHPAHEEFKETHLVPCTKARSAAQIEIG